MKKRTKNVVKVEEKRGPGRPKGTDGGKVRSIWLPQEVWDLLGTKAESAGCKTRNEYIALLLMRDVWGAKRIA